MTRLKLIEPYAEIVRLTARNAELREAIFEAIAEMTAHPDQTERARDLLSEPFVCKRDGD